MERTFTRSMQAGLGIVIALLLINAGLTFYNTQRMSQVAGRVIHTHEVMDTTSDLLLTLATAEVVQRRFLTDGKEESQTAIRDALSKVSEKVAELKEQTKDNPDQQAAAEKLIAMTEAQVAQLREGMRLRRGDAGKEEMAKSAAQSMAQMSAIRALVWEMRRQEDQLLTQRKAQYLTAHRFAVTTGLLTTLLALGGIAGFAWLLQLSLEARQKTAVQVQEQHEWLNTTLASIADAVLTTDAQGKVIYLNPVAEALTGWAKSEAAGQPLESIFRIVSEKDRQKVENPALRALQEGRIFGLANHTVLIARDGGESPLEDSAAPIKDAQGHVIGAVLIFREVKERRRLERLQSDLHAELERLVAERTAELRASEERFRLVIEGTKDFAIFMLDPQGRVVSWNAGAERIMGHQAEEIVGQSIARFYTEADLQQGKHEHLLRAAEAEGQCEDEGWRMRKDGSLFWAGALTTALRDADGQLKGFSKIVRDLTERKQVEARIAENQRFVERIAEMMPSIVYVYDLKEERNIFANNRIETLLGYPSEHMKRLGVTLFQDNVHADDMATTERAYEQFLTAEDGAIIEFEYRVRHAGGEWRWLHTWHTVFARDGEGTPSQLLGIAQDVTERKRLEQEVVETAAMEQRRIGQELHDGTGQELTGLCMLADTLANTLREYSPNEAQLAHRIARGLQVALGTVRALSRGLIPVEVDAEGLMVALSELAKRIRELHAVQCTFDCFETIPMEDNITATQLYRIAQEAITNALKHSQANNLRVSLEARGNYITLRIADDGIGLPDSHHEAEGMGLRIMKYRAGQIGAHLVVRPGPTRGTVVTCTLYRGSASE